MLYQECIFLCGTLVLLRIPASPETVWFVIFPIILSNIYHKFPKYYKDEVRLYTMMYIFSLSVSHRPVLIYIFSHSVSHRPVFMYIFSHSVSHRPVFYVHFQSFSETSSCFLCTFSVIQWVMVLFLCTFSFIQWVIVLFSYVHFQSFSESSSCFEEFHDDLLAFIIIIVWYIFRISGIQCPVWRCHWRSTWSNYYCNDHFRDPILHEKER